MANRFNPEFDPSSDLYDVEAGRADLINPYYTQRLDAQSNAAASLIGGTVASVVDFGATTINSLTFGAADLNTASLLSRISDNALQVYQENRDTIETASFIGGILAPSALALKGIQALKSGTKGLNILSQERRAADLAQLNNLARQGPAASKALDDLQSAIYLRGAASQTLDAAAMEVGVLMAANQHPYMEDYLEDPIKNFGISVALGGVIGAGLGHIGDRFAVKNVIGQAHLDAFEAIKGGLQKGDSALQDVGEGFMAVDKLQVQQANIDHLNAILKGANKSEDGLTREYASRWLEILRSEQETTFQNFMGNMVKDIPDDLATTLRDRFYNDIRFQHIDVVKQAKIAENNKLVAPAPVAKQNVFGKLFETKGKNKVEAAITRVYVPEADSFVSAGDLKHIGRANSLKGVTAESVKKHSGVAQNKIMAADQDAGMLLNSLSAPEVDKMYAEAFTYVDQVADSMLSRATLGGADLPMLQATLLRMRKDIEAGKLNDTDTITVISKQVLPDTPVPQGTTTTLKLNAQQLTDYVLDLKQRMITDLAKTGTDELGIAIRTNTTVDAVRDFLLNKKPLGTSNASAFEYHSLTALDEKLGMGNQPLAMSSNVRKKSWAVVQAQMDKQTMDKINNQIIGSFLRQSQAPIARALHSMFFTKESARILNIVRGQLGYANNGYAGTRFVESADSAYRLMKELGTFATYTGQRIEELGNATMKRFLEPLKGTMEKVAVDVAKRTELDIARQLNASLAGWRSYHDRQFWQKAMQMAEDGKQVEVEVPVMFRGKAFMVQSDEVDELLTAFGKIGREMYATKNLGHKIIGRPNMNDIGYWLPSNNPRNKFIGYIHDVEANATRLVIANTADDLQEMLMHLNKRYSNEVAKGTMLIFDKQSQKHLNLVRGRDDALFMRVANEDMLHSGSSASLFMKSNADPLAEIIGGIEHSVIGNVTQLAETALWDISSTLKRMSEVNQAKVANQPLSKYVKALNKQKDAAAEVRNTMFNLKSLPDYTTWNDINSGFESAVGWTMQKLSESWKAIRPASGKELSYDEYKKALTKAGVMDTFANFGAQAEEFYKHSYGTDVGNQAARLVTLANGYAATSALRFGDLAQPLVNAMSLPILMMGNALDKFPASFMGVAKKAEIKGMLGATQVMHDGVRAMNSQAHAGLDKLWRDRGYFQPIVSEASDVLSLPRDLTPGLMTSLEKGLKHKIVEDWLAKPADYAEQLTRRTAMHTGAVLARRMYPGLSDEATTIFAKSFMDRVIGNYHAAQRPVFFQGTLGVAMGLFQTYFLTITQAMYRQLQLGNKKALGAMMLTQGGVFGAASLPGFNQISAMIGEHYSDEHVDLRTGTIRAVSDPVAKAILYGLPSNMGPALYTRGELAPRISTPANLEALPQVQMFGQVAGTMSQMISALGAPSEDVPRNLLQALSMQSVNRPIARLSEIASGYSVTSQGNTVSTPDEVWTVTGVMARLLGARTTEEALAREALHLDRFYESGDRENRQKVVNALRTAIRAGTDDGDKIDKLALDYIDEGGTPAGWRSAVRTAIMTTEQPLNETLKDKLKEDSAINIMIDSLDD